MSFANPTFLALVLLVPVAVWWSLRGRRRGAARFSTLRLAAKVPAGWASFGPPLLALLRGTALILLVVALARPRSPEGVTVRGTTEGIAIQLAIDNSLSMKYQDYDWGGTAVARMDAVKHAVRLFVKGGAHGLPGRPADKIGLISFSRYPDVLCPATLDHDALLRALDDMGYGPPMGTNIGDGLAWALDRLRKDPTQEKIIILLSDGSHNVREGLPPLEAARLAADLKIRVYTIGAVGNRAGKSVLADALRRAQGKRTADDAVDETTLRAVAEQTGGKYFRATDTDGLLQICQAIDRLETTKLDKTTRVHYRELYLWWLIPALGLLAVEQLLAATRLLRIP